jgi:hypothetical protein
MKGLLDRGNKHLAGNERIQMAEVQAGIPLFNILALSKNLKYVSVYNTGK